MGPRIQPGRGVDRGDSFILEQFADAEDVIGVAHGDATVQVVGAHDYGDAGSGFGSIAALSLGDQAAFGDAAAHQVIASDAALAVMRILGGASGGDHYRRYSALEQIKSVIQAGAQYWRGPPGILGSSKNHNGVRRMNFLPGSSFNDFDGCSYAAAVPAGQRQ